MNKLEQNKIDFINFLPEELKEEFNTYSFIAGGAVYCFINNIEINDFDFFLKDQNFANKIYKYFNDLKEKNDNEYRAFDLDVKALNYNGRRVIVTPNAITFQAPKESNESDWQIVIKFVGPPLEVISEFDFKHNMLYWDNNEDGFKDNIRYYYSIPRFVMDSEDNFYLNKQLNFNSERARDISGVLLRLPKFIKRGFTISKEEHSKIIKKLLGIVENKNKYYDINNEVCDYEFGGFTYSGMDNYNREVEILDSHLEY